MASAGEEIENPLLGLRLVFRRTASDTGGELLEMDCYFKPSRGFNQPHVHPAQEESFTVISGGMEGRVDGKPVRVEPGETSTVPRNTPHIFTAEGDTHILLEFRPALRTETLFETLFGLARDGRLPKSGRPGLLQTAAIFTEYSGEIRPAGAPEVVIRFLRWLAPLARRLGYLPWYPEYTRTRP